MTEAQLVNKIPLSMNPSTSFHMVYTTQPPHTNQIDKITFRFHPQPNE
jgi:hypothetical protein